MSLYGPRINLPKVEIPSSAGKSWNLEKEKKIALFVIAAIIILILLAIILPPIIQGITEYVNSSMNPSVKVSWKNNPLDLTKEIKEATMEILITNTTKQNQNVSFNITSPSKEIIIFCPNSIYDTNLGAYLLENISPSDIRKIPCIVRRNSEESVFSGIYTISIDTSLGKITTNLEIISK
jgi:hypothetical protein